MEGLVGPTPEQPFVIPADRRPSVIATELGVLRIQRGVLAAGSNHDHLTVNDAVESGDRRHRSCHRAQWPRGLSEGLRRSPLRTH